ncbi:hypothetical protein FA95DRAFT_94316 [Auriscalpium vulgare]|uniref:Uncharacterized protein n=1 Tax=Auriscalpium vulgare TaxID=40419 RepID=A0ACB8R086_9AGAM|nr:hypothetical protein FA95DRAFT_94316 [Auriscalpium vulgare]
MRTSSNIASFALVVSAALGASALNDWSVPCTQGQCSYDLPAAEGAPSGSLKIWGSSGAISDITHAAGWTILDCNPHIMDQDIRMVCHNPAGQCGHLLENGAEGKIVRLPENCGKMPFAHVKRAWIPKDQSMPAVSGIKARDDTSGVVQALALSTNFAAASPSDGNVSFAIQGTSLPGANGDFNVTADAQRRSEIRADIARRGFISNALQKLSNLTKFNKTLSETLPPIDFDKPFNLFNTSIDCPANQFVPAAFSAKVSVDVEAKMHAVIQVGVVAAGTVIPPKITEIGVFGGLDGNMDSTLTVKANGIGKFDSGDIPIFEAGIPGLDFPGFLSIGPTFKVNGHVTADLELDLDASVDLNYNFDGVKLLFPPQEGSSSGSFTKGTNALSVSTSPTLDATANIEGHLIPSLNIGINALGGTAQATVFLNLDASATVALNSTATARLSASNTAGGSAGASVQGCVDISSALNVAGGASANFLNLFDQSKTVNLFQKNFDLFSVRPSLTDRVRRQLMFRVEVRRSQYWRC